MSENHNKSEATFGLEGWNLPEKRTPFEIPNGYFDQFSSDVLAAVKAAQSVTDPELTVPDTDIFEVPDTYFDTLPDIISKRVAAANLVIEGKELPWADENRNNPFELPKGYFETLTKAVKEQVFSGDNDIEAASSLLDALKKEHSYAVPAGYFEQNEQEITAKVQPTHQPKTMEHPAVRTMRLGSWAAAAVIFIVLGLGAWQFLGSTGTNNNHAMAATHSANTNYRQQIAQLPNEAIHDYIHNHLDEFDVNLIENTVSRSGSGISSSAALSGFSDEEIEAYLDGDI